MTATRQQQYDPVAVRQERARKALAEGLYTIRRSGSEESILRWNLENGGGKTYTITYDRDRKEFACTCPDFANRGEKVGTCKHIEAVKIWERQRRATGKANGASTHETREMTEDPLWALVEALREQNEILREIHWTLRQIDIALAKGLGIA